VNIVVIGAGGIGAYYGTKLSAGGNNVLFVARGKHLESIQSRGLRVVHTDFVFHQSVEACPLSEITQKFPAIDVVLLTTKADATPDVAQSLQDIFGSDTPYVVSLQNGVENERILMHHLPDHQVIGGISRKLGSFVKEYGVIEATGDPETIVGSFCSTEENRVFLSQLQDTFHASNLHLEISEDIQKELWTKLVINNGVNALCALLQEKTGVVMQDNALSELVYHLMYETSVAARSEGVRISSEQVEAMHSLIANFLSIKPSMQVDVEKGRNIEIDEICGAVIRGCEATGEEAPYTRTIATLLEFTYRKRGKK